MQRGVERNLESFVGCVQDPHMRQFLESVEVGLNEHKLWPVRLHRVPKLFSGVLGIGEETVREWVSGVTTSGVVRCKIGHALVSERNSRAFVFDKDTMLAFAAVCWGAKLIIGDGNLDADIEWADVARDVRRRVEPSLLALLIHDPSPPESYQLEAIVGEEIVALDRLDLAGLRVFQEKLADRNGLVRIKRTDANFRAYQQIMRVRAKVFGRQSGYHEDLRGLTWEQFRKGLSVTIQIIEKNPRFRNAADVYKEIMKLPIRRARKNG